MPVNLGIVLSAETWIDYINMHSPYIISPPGII